MCIRDRQSALLRRKTVAADPVGDQIGQGVQEWREWHQPGCVTLGTRYEHGRLSKPVTLSTASSARDYEGCNDWLQRSDEFEEAEDALVNLKLELHRIRDSFAAVQGPEELGEYLFELCRPGGVLVQLGEGQQPVETRMPAHLVYNGKPVPVTHDGKRELLQIIDSFVRTLVSLQRLSVTSDSAQVTQIIQESETISARFTLMLAQFVQRSACAAAKIGDLPAIESFMAARQSELVARISSSLSEIDPLEMFHSSVFGGDVPIAMFILQSTPEQNLLSRLSHDGTALHLAAYTGKPDMIRALINEGADVNASSSSFDIRSETRFKKAREVTAVSVADVPWKYQSKTQEYTPADVFHDFCPYQHQGLFADQAEARVIFDGLAAKRHGSDYLSNTFVYWDAVTGEQHPEDPADAQVQRRLAMEDEKEEGEDGEDY
eukprot:TRINITY_DN39741_c0_g1_i1.p1 TRINITY_DN39741_c0_g1~~TRINITY_DN39741_c0_g1_i1.p1  ORF type:complete len:433 (-),score=106.82 TRINITY_DN39741_c0_g1_i1:273-1571(-)